MGKTSASCLVVSIESDSSFPSSRRMDLLEERRIMPNGCVHKSVHSVEVDLRQSRQLMPPVNFAHRPIDHKFPVACCLDVVLPDLPSTNYEPQLNQHDVVLVTPRTDADEEPPPLYRVRQV